MRRRVPEDAYETHNPKQENANTVNLLSFNHLFNETLLLEEKIRNERAVRP